MRSLEGVIEYVGGLGHGVFVQGGERYFVPFTVAGDHVQARPVKKTEHGFLCELRAVLTPGPGRAEPPCPHFHACGGCQMQMMGDDFYRAWKTDLVRGAMTRRGLDGGVVRAVMPGAPAQRRRAEFALKRRDRDIVAGFHEAQGKKIIDVAQCPVLMPGLVAVLPALRAGLLPFLKVGQSIDAKATMADNGLDLVLKGDLSEDLALREAMSDLARKQDWARLAVMRDGFVDLLYQARAPQVRMADTTVDLPVDAFLQATQKAESAMQSLVLDGLDAGVKTAVDLFSGLGAFAWPMAERAIKVAAYDNAPESMAAMNAAAARVGGQGRVRAEARDLFLRPLAAQELDRFDAVVFDPPYAGASAQAAEMAKCKKPRVILAVSCNPASFARDAKILSDGGWRLEWVQPVDQFLWSRHVEIVARFIRS